MSPNSYERVDRSVEITVENRLYRVTLMLAGAAKVQRVIFGTFEAVRTGSIEYRAAVAAATSMPRED